MTSYRPAAVDQIKALGSQLKVPVYDEGTAADPVDIAKHGVEWAREKGRDVLIIDTAGRLHIDEKLMDELVRHPQPGQAAQHPVSSWTR